MKFCQCLRTKPIFNRIFNINIDQLPSYQLTLFLHFKITNIVFVLFSGCKASNLHTKKGENYRTNNGLEMAKFLKCGLFVLRVSEEFFRVKNSTKKTKHS